MTLADRDPVNHLRRILAGWIDWDRETGCWLYTGQQSRDGYGKVWRAGRRVFLHRFTYEFFRGRIPDGLQIDHLCRVKRCCNPWHLEVVTLAENRRRAAAAITECKRGHTFDAKNTIRTTDGRRQCRECKNARRRKAA